jgi:hypothetical protein
MSSKKKSKDVWKLAKSKALHIKVTFQKSQHSGYRWHCWISNLPDNPRLGMFSYYEASGDGRTEAEAKTQAAKRFLSPINS